MDNIDDLIRQSKSLMTNSEAARDALSRLYYKFPRGSKSRETVSWIIHDSNHDFAMMDIYARRKSVKYRYNRLEGYLRTCHRWLRILELIAELAKE